MLESSSNVGKLICIHAPYGTGLPPPPSMNGNEASLRLAGALKVTHTCMFNSVKMWCKGSESPLLLGITTLCNVLCHGTTQNSLLAILAPRI